MVTVAQVAQAAAGALERGKGGGSYPIGGTNMPWAEFIPLVLETMGGGARVMHLPKFLYRLGVWRIARANAKQGRESGLNLVALAQIMYRQAYIDPAPSMAALGYGSDNIRVAIRETVAECLRKPD